MPIDTSSYYPETTPPDGQKDPDSLNSRNISLFGSSGSENKEQPDNPETPEKGNETPSQADQEKSELTKAIDITCHVISWLLMPLLMPVIGILYIFRLSVLDVVSPGLQTAFTFIIAGINLVIPVLIIVLLKLLKVVQDVGLNGRKERTIPYIITALCYGASAWFVASRGAPIWMVMFFVGGGLASLINLSINFRWKISAHAAAIAGVIALLVRLEKDVAVEPQLFLWLLITVGAAGLLGSARVWMGRHTVWQVLAGYAVGFCSVFFLMYIH